jgi:hypothetical protein
VTRSAAMRKAKQSELLRERASVSPLSQPPYFQVGSMSRAACSSPVKGDSRERAAG